MGTLVPWPNGHARGDATRHGIPVAGLFTCRRAHRTPRISMRIAGVAIVSNAPKATAIAPMARK